LETVEELLREEISNWKDMEQNRKKTIGNEMESISIEN